jgi:hypothetical protein
MINFAEEDALLPGDPLGALRAAHHRIASALEALDGVAERLKAETLDHSARESLRRSLRGLHTAASLHAADDVESLFPRLRAALAGRAPSARFTLRILEQEHVVAEAAHWLLDEMSEELLQTGCFERAEKHARFCRLVAVLRHLFEEHARLEEEEVLPLVSALAETGELEALGREMVARRRTG